MARERQIHDFAAQAGNMQKTALWHHFFPSRHRQQSRYREHYLDTDINQTLVILGISFAFIATLTFMDFLGPETGADLVLGAEIRGGFVVLIAMVGYAVWRVRQPWAIDASAAMTSLVMALGIATYHYTNDISLLRMTSIAILFTYFVHIGFPTYPVFVALPAAGLVVAEINLASMTEGGDFEDQAGLASLFMITALILAVFVSALLQRSRFIAFEASLQVKTLSGLLPICAQCKKIRDDDGYYQQIEHYIHEHSEAEFTHGICPDCARVFLEDYENQAKP